MPTPEQDAWVRQVLGADPAAGSGAPPPAAPGGGTAPGAPRNAAGASGPAPPRDEAEAAGLDSDKTLLAGVALAFKELAAQRKRLVDAGLDTHPLDIQIAGFQADLASAKADPEWRTRHVSLENLRHDAERAAVLAGDADAQIRASTQGTAAAIGDLCTAAAKLIANVPKGKARDMLDKRLEFLKGWIRDVGSERDPKRRKLAIEDIDLEAQSLLDAAAKRTGNTTAAQAAYAEALHDKYGFEVSNPIGTPNTHLDRVYKMFEKVPVGHVAQDSLRELSYEASEDEAAFGGATIVMGAFGARPHDTPYIDPTGAQPRDSPQNSFDISALHELGHSMDDRWGIMERHGDKPGCGSWMKEDSGSVADAVAVHFLSSKQGLVLNAPFDLVKAAIATALETGKASRPARLSDADWKALHKVLAQCLDMKDGKEPWKRPQNIGGRTYHEAYPGYWVSCNYDSRQNAGITVRDYQWRAPGEFFAELYAWTWLNRKEPPGGIDKAIAEYMFKQG